MSNEKSRRPMGPEAPSARKQRGFSLMELMVVIAILGILSTIVVKNVIPMIGKGKANAAKASVQTIKEIVTTYWLNNSRLPDSLETLTQPDPNNDDEPYLDNPDSLIDPWKNPYEYTQESSRKFVVISRGADGLPGGEGEDADITSKDLKN